MESKNITLNLKELAVLKTILKKYIDEQNGLLEQRIIDGRDIETLPQQIKSNEELFLKLESKPQKKITETQLSLFESK